LEVAQLARQGNILTFRLRKVDADLIQAIELLDRAILSELCRDGLRLMLGIRTTKQMKAVDRVIVPAAVSARIGSRPYVPVKGVLTT
jgi:hypothetical protein